MASPFSPMERRGFLLEEAGAALGFGGIDEGMLAVEVGLDPAFGGFEQGLVARVGLVLGDRPQHLATDVRDEDDIGDRDGLASGGAGDELDDTAEIDRYHGIGHIMAEAVG